LTIRFSSERRLSTFIPPDGDGHPVQRYSELRRDPLTHRSGRVAHFVGFKLVAPDLARVVEASRAGCPFCPERILQVTPKLDPAISPSGRIQRGEANLFPNISPYDRHSVVVVLTEEHFVPGNQFTAQQLADGLQASIEYFRSLPQVPRGTHSVLTWNYMPPSGATQVHAHLQGFSTNRPGSLLEEEVRYSRAFWRRQGRSYWEELAAAEESGGERFVARGSHTVWLTSFVSRSVVGDLLTIFPGHGQLEELAQDAVAEYSQGLQLALASLHDEGIRAFNLAFYAAPSQERTPHFQLHARLSPRIYFNPAIEGSDATAWQHLLDEPFMVRSPEALATRLRERLQTLFTPTADRTAPGNDAPRQPGAASLSMTSRPP
jgi:galactose-1-phosphate uridylyltransferase